MTNRILKSVFCIFLLSALCFNIIIGQTSDLSSGQEIIQQQLKMLTTLNDSIFDNKKDLVNGKVYYSGGNKFIHPFYADNSWKPATIFSAGAVYEAEFVKYDLYLDYLVLLHSSDSLSYPICLNKESVKEFIIYGSHFIYLGDFEGSTLDELVPGYYEAGYTGETRFYVRRIKLKTFDSPSLSEVYSDRVYFFMYKNGKYFRLKGKNSLFKILNDRRKEIKGYMKTNNIRFSQDDYVQIGKVLEYYDSL